MRVLDLPMPHRIVLEPSGLDSRAEAEAEEQARFDAAVAELAASDYVVIDCPGSYSTYSRLAHAAADTLITPMNDSLVDFDMLARLDPASGRIKGPSVYAEMLPGKLGYLRLINFGEKSVEEFVSALDQLQDDGMEALLFDLRYNPGGFLSAAVAIVDLFVGESADPIVTQQGRGEPVSTMATAGERPNYPMVILVNGRSASASEVVAGALKDFHRATLVGQRTFGKGSVQNLFPMSPH